MSDQFIGELGIRNSAPAAAVLVQRTYGEGLADQYKRELIWNGVQAGARNIFVSAVRLPEFGETGGVKAAYVDDGSGMSADKLLDYFGELFNGRSELSAEGNFQMGARVSTLPWNPIGVVVASWTEGDPDGAVLWIAYDPASKTYRFRPYVDEDGVLGEVGVPPAYLRHPAIARAGHGTAVVLLGTSPTDHTVGEVRREADGRFHYPAFRSNDDDMFYVNSKWNALPTGVRVSFMWGIQDLSTWAERIKPGEFWETATRVEGSLTPGHHRNYLGVRDRMATEAEATGAIQVRSAKGYRATVHWALFPISKYERSTPAGGGASDERDYFIPLGLFGELHGDEVYGLRARGLATSMMERYGITHKDLRSRMALLVEPDSANARFIGAHPTSARDRLVIANEGLPHGEWGESFADQLPKEVRDRLRQLNGEVGKSDADRQAKLADRLRHLFGRPYRKGGQTPVVEQQVPEGRPKAAVTGRANSEDTERTGSESRHPGKAIGDDLVGAVDSTLMGRARTVRQSPPINVVFEWEDELGYRPVHLTGSASTTTLVRVNPEHYLITELIAAEKRSRSAARADEVEQLAREGIAGYLVDTIVGARTFAASRMIGGLGVGGRKFVDTQVTSETLTVSLTNIPAVENAIRNKFRGRPGLGARYASEDEAA